MTRLGPPKGKFSLSEDFLDVGRELHSVSMDGLHRLIGLLVHLLSKGAGCWRSLSLGSFVSFLGREEKGVFEMSAESCGV